MSGCFALWFFAFGMTYYKFTTHFLCYQIVNPHSVATRPFLRLDNGVRSAYCYLLNQLPRCKHRGMPNVIGGHGFSVPPTFCSVVKKANTTNSNTTFFMDISFLSVPYLIQTYPNHVRFSTPWYMIPSMKIISWNVNGIRAVHKKGLFTKFVEKYKPDILCLQETKAHEHQSEVDLAGYEEYWNSATRAGYSGTAIFTKQKPLSVALDIPKEIAKKYKFDDGYGDANTEGRVIALELKDFFVVSVYTPNAKDDLTRIPLRHKHWDPAFLAYMKLLEKQKPVIFCGDLNAAHTEDDLARPKENEGRKGFTNEEREGIDNIVQAGFVDTFRMFTKGNGHYTWWSHFANARARNIGWRIDYVFVSKKLEKNVTKALIHKDVMGSDHCPIEIEVK